MRITSKGQVTIPQSLRERCGLLPQTERTAAHTPEHRWAAGPHPRQRTLMVLVDSTVILDVATQDPHWSLWSRQQWKDALTAGPVVINVIVYGEIAFACERIEVVDEILAARAHADDRERGGQRQRILPDVLIGAHALVERIPLLTRDARRYRQAFQGLELITPQR